MIHSYIFVITWQSKITLIRKLMMSLISNKLLSMLLMLRTLLRLRSVPLIQANVPQTAVQVILEMCYFLRVIVTTYTHLGAKHHTGLICYKSERVRPGREAFYPVASIWMVCNTIFLCAYSILHSAIHWYFTYFLLMEWRWWRHFLFLPINDYKTP